MFIILFVAVLLPFWMTRTTVSMAEDYVSEADIKKVIQLFEKNGDSLLIFPVTLDNRDFTVASPESSATITYSNIHIEPIDKLTYEKKDTLLILKMDEMNLRGKYSTTAKKLKKIFVSGKQGKFDLRARNVVINYSMVTQKYLRVDHIEIGDVTVKYSGKSSKSRIGNPIANVIFNVLGKRIFRKTEDHLKQYLTLYLETSIQKLFERNNELEHGWGRTQNSQRRKPH